MTISEELAAFVAGLQPGDLPGPVREDARWRFVDLIGVCLAGSRLDSAGPIVKVASAMGGRAEATTIAFGHRLPAPLAGWVNGAVGHGSDFDDAHAGVALHASVVAVPAALAMAERQGASGSACVAAMVVASEIGIRVISGVAPHRFHKRGIHGTGVAGPFMAAATGAKLLNLDSTKTANAFGLAGSQSAGLMQGLVDGTWVKQLHPGWGVQAGLTVALLAELGFSGPSEVFEGKFGIFNALLYGDEGSLQLHEITKGLGTRWLAPGTNYKPYPTGGWNQASMRATKTILEREKLEPNDLERIECNIPSDGIAIVCEPREAKIHPRSPYHMRFSLPYAVAMLVLGHAGVEDYTERVLKDQAIAAMAERVHARPDPDLPPDLLGARVVITTKAGRRFEHTTEAMPGGLEIPMKPEEHRDKFRANAVPVLGKLQSEELLQAIEEIPDAANLDKLMKLSTKRV